MTSIRDSVAVVSVVQPLRPASTRRGRAERHVREQIARGRVPFGAVERALELAGGDARRLRFLDDGSVLVANDARGGTRWVTRR